jgi:hypothetical protein
MVLSGAVCYAGVEDFQLSVRNLTQPAPNRIEFDVYLLDTDPGQPFELSGCQIGFLLNSLIYNGGVLSVAIDNTGSGLVPDQQLVSAPDVVSSLAGYPGMTLIRLAGNTGPPIPPGAGSGTVISTTGFGTLLTHFIVTSSVDFTPNSTADLSFTAGSAVSPLYPTRVDEYIDAIDTQLPVTPGVNAVVYGNPLLNATLPMAFNVTGSGSYCVGGSGLTVGLDDSEADVTYTLFRDGLEVSTLAGDGDAITFGLRLAGTYTVEGTNSAGTISMNGQAEIIAVVNTVTPGSSAPTLCLGTLLTSITHTTTGATGIGSPSNLPTGVTAAWSANTVTISGTPTAGGVFNYNIPLTGGCGTVSATGTITVNTIPTITGVTSGSRCGPGTVILGATASAGVINWYTNLSGGVSLFTGTSFTTPVISTNTSYYVDATSNGCTSPARTMVMAIVNTVPTITNTTPASRCGTGTVILGATPSEGIVSWYAVPSGGISVGTGPTFTTPDLSINTTYWVDATNNGCTSPSRTAVIATVNPIPTITGTTPDSRCGTGTVTLGATASAGTLNWYSAAVGGGSLGSGISFTTPSLSATTTYWVDATNLGCTSTPRTSVVATINPVPATPVHTVDCSLGFNHAGITVTSPVGAGYQYRLNSGIYQVSPVFTEVINGSYTITVINSSNCTTTGTSFDVSCGCVNGPTVTLSSINGSTCGTAPITVINNSFGGSATSVTIIENGAGTVSPAATSATPFAFTYTPAAGDIGNTVTITVTTDNPLGVPCATAFATYTLTVNAVPTITGTTPGSRCGTGTVIIGATASAGTVNWYSASTGGGSIGTGNSFTTPVISASTTFYADATNNGCTTAGRTPVVATVLQVPPAAGTISGSTTFTPGTAGVPYSVVSVPGATGYVWGYSGTGVTINGSGTSVTLDFAANATSGSLSVYGTNTCGQGTAATLTLSTSNKTLTLTSVLLEGLYNASGTMRQAQNATGAQWPAGVADHITVELHSSSNYATIIWSQTDVSLSTAGTAVITVPASYNGSYYITVKHRNSVETTTITPVSFAGTVINRVFGSAAGIYGANLRASGDGYFLMFGGDVNQDGYVDSGDYPDVVNDNFNYISGYLSTDINGDGLIDSGDYPIMVNNNLNYIGTIHP